MERATVIRARLARAQRFGAPAEEIERLQQGYHAAKAASFIREYLASDPRPTIAARRELADLLTGGDSNAAA